MKVAKVATALGFLMAGLAAMPATSTAQQLAYTSKNVNLRAGPAWEYPVVAIIPAGVAISVEGCLSDYRWCDVLAGPYRGWVYAGNIVYPYQGATVPLLTYGAVIGIGIIAFNLGSYWDDHYRGRPWYPQRQHWIDRPRPAFGPGGNRLPTPRPGFEPGVGQRSSQVQRQGGGQRPAQVQRQGSGQQPPQWRGPGQGPTGRQHPPQGQQQGVGQQPARGQGPSGSGSSGGSIGSQHPAQAHQQGGGQRPAQSQGSIGSRRPAQGQLHGGDKRSPRGQGPSGDQHPPQGQGPAGAQK